MAKKQPTPRPPKQASRASNLGYPSPPTGQGRQTGGQAYPAPTGGPINSGLGATSHNGSNYPQPNSAGNPDPTSTAPPGAVPSAAAYRPSLAGNALTPSVVNPGVDADTDEPPDYPQS